MTRKLFRGTSIKECEKYKEKGIPKGKKFTNELKEARRFGKCIVSIDTSKKELTPLTSENEAQKLIGLKTRYYKNKKLIKKFKFKNS